LWRRKPAAQPTRARDKMATKYSPFTSPTTNSQNDAMAATSADSPPMLSRRLKVFVMPTTHTTATTASRPSPAPAKWARVPVA
jgi:hypothetical protein